jgi:(1->4)-alpha-D-glucan 1-alpha-D-glucosylmutase
MAAERPAVPRATYRLQFRNGFGFAEAAEIAPYLARLGISHVYASPIFTARAGSSHGYDIVDFNALDPALGGAAGFEDWQAALRRHRLGLILDFVPNHMGIGADNPWWQDVLTFGPASAYAGFFDIDWPAGDGKVGLPLLGDRPEAVLASGELTLGFDPAAGRFELAYHQHRWPLAPRHYGELLRLADAGGRLNDLAAAFERAGNRETAAAAMADLAARVALAPELRQAITAALQARQPGADPAAGERIRRLLDAQSYRLADWRSAAGAINYRRFFEIDDLIALRMERPEVFAASHRLLLRLIGERRIDGVRLDHIDGLWDPAAYCARLMAAAAQALGRPPPSQAEARRGRPIYLLVEKILGQDEDLRRDLPVAGTTGYEFMNAVGGLFVDPAAAPRLTATYERFVGAPAGVEALVAEAKAETLEASFAGELDALAAALHALCRRHPEWPDPGLAACRQALAELIVAFPIYRTYVTEAGAGPEDRQWLDRAIAAARAGTRLAEPALFDRLRRVLSTDLAVEQGICASPVLRLALRFQQLTGPVMAKAVEDTAFYRDARLVSLNEVGGEPASFGTPPAAFHAMMADRLADQPHGLLATATHDHKRGEDVRMRLHGLSELAADWAAHCCRWRKLALAFRQTQPDPAAPTARDEYLLYQTLLGVWPPDLAAGDAEGLNALAERVAAYLVKASREAKRETSWTAPDDAYEAALERFVRHLLDPVAGLAFQRDLMALQPRIAVIGVVNGLAQTLLRLTAPGVPDHYQGAELWDLSLVDPDNRRPVDFAARARMLASRARPDRLLAAWPDGRIKQRLIRQTLALRRRQPALFAAGTYQPLAADGAAASRLLAFAREHAGAAMLVVVPRLVAPLLADPQTPRIAPARWADTALLLPAGLAGRPALEVLAGRGLTLPAYGRLPLARLLDPLPLALLSLDRQAS